MTERLFYNDNYETRSTRSQVESKQKLSGPAALGRDTEEEGDISGSEIVSEKELVQVTYILYNNRNPSPSVQFSHSDVSDSLRPHESQHARPPCPTPTPGVH